MILFENHDLTTLREVWLEWSLNWIRGIIPAGRASVIFKCSMGISGSWNGGTVLYKGIFSRDITLHRPKKSALYMESVPPINRILEISHWIIGIPPDVIYILAGLFMGWWCMMIIQQYQDVIMEFSPISFHVLHVCLCLWNNDHPFLIIPVTLKFYHELGGGWKHEHEHY